MTLGRAWIKVVIRYAQLDPEGTPTGDVITAYFVPLVHPQEAPLWP